MKAIPLENWAPKRDDPRYSEYAGPRTAQEVFQELRQRLDSILRRMAGSITEYVNEVGQRPLRISDYDKAVLAIQDGNLEQFQETLPKLQDQAGELLAEAAGRPGVVGRQMCQIMLSDVKGLSSEVYLTACKKAIDTADLERVKLFAEQAKNCVDVLDLTLHGDMICHAYGEEKKHIATALVQQCTREQIASAKSVTLYLPALRGDFSTMQALVDKGIDANDCADQILHTLHASHNGWMAEHLLKQGLKIDNYNFPALHACIRNGGLECGRLLLDSGMDFDLYQRWAEQTHAGTDGHDDTLQALAEHWTQRQVGQEQSGGQEAGGMTLG